MIRILTAGESHGPLLTVIMDGIPAGLRLEECSLNREMARRQHGYGRGNRMIIEKDCAMITAGVRLGWTTGAPISLSIPNRDHENWQKEMSVTSQTGIPAVTCPRPGHADLAGALKYGRRDLRDILERASARETAARVAAGAVCKRFLEEFGITLYSQTVAVGTVAIRRRRRAYTALDRSPLRCADPDQEKSMMRLIDHSRQRGDSLGGITEITARGVCPGLGSHTQHDRRLDARIGSAMLSIPSVKGVSLGDAFAVCRRPGSESHDEIFYHPARGWYHQTNHAGGLEGGMTNGSPVVIRLAVKPVPTLNRALRSVDLVSKKTVRGHRERADVCVVPAVGVIAEAMLAWILADCLLEKFGSDTMAEIRQNYRQYCKRINRG